jgi:hypothetical protein
MANRRILRQRPIRSRGAGRRLFVHGLQHAAEREGAVSGSRAICLSEFEAGEAVKELPCCHWYHSHWRVRGCALHAYGDHAAL